MTFFTADQETTLDLLLGGEENHAEMVEFLRSTVGPFAAERVAPGAAACDEQETFSDDSFRALGDLGFLALPYPEKYSGLGADFSYLCAGLETLAKADAGFALGVGIHGTMTDGLNRFGSDALKDAFLEDLIYGRKFGAFALSEAGSGSDARNMKTTWRRDGDQIVLNGSKYWITNGLSADVFFVMAVGEDGEVSSFLVTKDGEGSFDQQKIAGKMGVRGSNTAELIFDDYRISSDRLIGEEGKGFAYAMQMLNGGRVTIAAQAVGIGQGAYEKLLKYSHERELFGRFLKDLDNTKHELALMQIELSASRQMSYAAAHLRATGRDDRGVQAAMAKVKATETAVQCSQRAIQLAGGYGYVEESRIERALRDALLHRIGEGANEALTMVVIPRHLFGEFAKNPPGEPW